MPKYKIKHGKYRNLEGKVFTAGQEVELAPEKAARFPDVFEPIKAIVPAKAPETPKVLEAKAGEDESVETAETSTPVEPKAPEAPKAPVVNKNTTQAKTVK